MKHIQNLSEIKNGICQVFSTMQKLVTWNLIGKYKNEDKKFQRKVQEALEIQFQKTFQRRHGLNQDDGQYVATNFWKLMFPYLLKKSSSTFLL